MHIQDIECNGIVRTVAIELRAHGSNANFIRVQGIQEAWVIGKAESLAAFLKNYEISLITAYKKFGLNINLLIFMALLILTPSINYVWQRALFVVIIFLILQALLWIHSRYIPNAFICMTEEKPTWWRRHWPSLASWIGTISSGIIIGLVVDKIIKIHFFIKS
jgi:hypothetical protein